MSKQTYEVEIKSLLGSEDNAQRLVQQLFDHDSNTQLVDESAQLNHYFSKGNLEKMVEKLKSRISEDEKNQIGEIINRNMDYSVRTRRHNNNVILVIKSSAGSQGNMHAVARVELEIEIIGSTLEELDTIILESDFGYQAKWSRQRKQYSYKSFTVCIDKNAGYGYLTEFEKITNVFSNISIIEQEILDEFNRLGITQLPKERLDRMFEHYNKNWHNYYGTDKTFVIH